MESTSHSPQSKSVILDTCVIQYLGKSNTPLSTEITNCLTKLETEGFDLTVSEMTFYENIQGLWGNKAKKAHALLKTYEYKQVTRLVLLTASLLGGLYKEEKIDGISTGDKIIAATAITENGYVLTANHKDFPHPFFTTEEAFVIRYKVGHYTRTLDIALYKPNIALFVRRIDEKTKENL